MSYHSLFHLNLKLNQTNKASQVVAESVAFLFSGDVTLRSAAELVCRWISDSCEIQPEESGRKPVKGRDTFTPENLFFFSRRKKNFTLLLQDASRCHGNLIGRLYETTRCQYVRTWE